MSTSRSLLRILFVGVTVAAGCATAPRGRTEAPPRVSDSAPDKVAAQRSAAGLHLEEEDDRWGLTAARELRQRREQKKAAQRSEQPQAVTPPVAPGPVDVQKLAVPGTP